MAAVSGHGAHERTTRQSCDESLSGPRVGAVDRVAASIAGWPRLGFDGMVMNCHDDSQRSNRLAVTVGHLRVVDRVAASVASWPRLGFDGLMMTRHDDSQRSGRWRCPQRHHLRWRLRWRAAGKAGPRGTPT